MSQQNTARNHVHSPNNVQRKENSRKRSSAMTPDVLSKEGPQKINPKMVLEAFTEPSDTHALSTSEFAIAEWIFANVFL